MDVLKCMQNNFQYILHKRFSYKYVAKIFILAKGNVNCIHNSYQLLTNLFFIKADGHLMGHLSDTTQQVTLE